MLDSLLCQAESPTLLGLFDLSTAPPLLFYSYIPIVFASLFFGFFVYYQDNKSLQSKLLLGISLFFSLWIVNILAQWVSSYHTALMFAWQLTSLFEVPIFALSLYFLYVFIYKKDIGVIYKTLLVTLIFAVIFYLPTTYNIESYDLEYCEGSIGLLWQFIYFIEIATIPTALLIGLIGYKSPIRKITKTEISFVTFGMVLFLGFFSLSNVFGEITKTYEINLFGPLGMAFFLALMSYLIVRYKTFNSKILSAQILIVTLVILIFSLLFVEDFVPRIIINCITLILVIIIGSFVIKGVEREVLQREKIEKLAVELEKANEQLKQLDQQKDELLGIVSHQLATPVSSIKWYLEMLIDGDLGKVTDEQKEHLKSMLGVAGNLSDLVSMILDVSRIQLGRMHIEKQELDLQSFFKEIVEIIEPKANEKKVNLIVKMPETLPKAMLDKRYTHMTIENLLSNAVKYTPEKGNVEFTVALKGNTMTVTVKDTGVGIPKAEQDKIFGKMFRASNVRNTVDGNGFGLYVAKGAVEAQGGKISFTSTEGKGTTFTVQLPLK